MITFTFANAKTEEENMIVFFNFSNGDSASAKFPIGTPSVEFLKWAQIHASALQKVEDEKIALFEMQIKEIQSMQELSNNYFIE